MIRYALSCSNGHDSESWFQSAAAFDRLRAAGMVACPECGATGMEKRLMAPQVQTARAAAARAGAEGAPAAVPPPSLGQPRDAREAALAELRRRIESESEYVGLAFAAEARAMHEGAEPARPIWGEARLDEARALIEDGIPVAPLPFRPRSQQN